MKTQKALSQKDWGRIIADALNESHPYPVDDLYTEIEKHLTEEDVTGWCEGELTFSDWALWNAVRIFFPDVEEIHIWGNPQGEPTPGDFSLPQFDETPGENLLRHVKAWDMEAVKTHAADLIEDADTSVSTFLYPIGIVWEGTGREQVVTMEVTAEMYSKHNPYTGKEENVGGHAHFETRDPDPMSDFLVADDMDSGTRFLSWASDCALEMDWTFSDLLEEAGVEYDTVCLGGDMHYYLDAEDEARAQIEAALRERFSERYPEEDPPATLEALRDLFYQ